MDSYGQEQPWHGQDVVNIEVKPQIKMESNAMFGSCGMLDMLATVATDQLRAAEENPPLKRIKTEQPEVTHKKRRKITEQDRISYSQLSKMSLNNLIKHFCESNFDELRRVYRYVCRLMAPDDAYGREAYSSFVPCEFESHSFGSETKAKSQMRSHLQAHIKDILNYGELSFSAEPIAARNRRFQSYQVKLEPHFLVPKLELIDSDIKTEWNHFDLPLLVSHDHSYAVALDDFGRGVKIRGGMHEEKEEEIDDVETHDDNLELLRIANESKELDEQVGLDSDHHGFITNEPVVRLGTNLLSSINQVPPSHQDPKSFVPLIGSEVDVNGIKRQHRRRRDSLNSPNSSDSGLSITEADVSADDVERTEALKAIEDLKGRGSNTLDLSCSICQPTRIFTAYTSLLNHLKSHAGIKDHVCHVCDAEFTRQSSLNYHISVHKNETKFVCAECGRKFRHPSHYKEHMHRHERREEETEVTIPVSKENNEPLPEFNATPPAPLLTDTPTTVVAKKWTKTDTTLSKETAVEFMHSEGPFVPTATLKDVSNQSTAAAPKAILATLNGKQVLLIPKETSKLEQCLRYGSAAVVNGSSYVNQFDTEEEQTNATNDSGFVETK